MPLMVACQEGHLLMAKLLVSKNCSVKIQSKRGSTTLHVASFYGRTAVTQYLIDHCGVNVDDQDNNGWTSLMMACEKGHLDTVQLLISKQCDTNIRTKNGWTALHAASSNGKTAVTEYLIDHCGVNVNEQNNNGWTSLMKACKKGHLGTVQLLVSKQCDINIRTKNGWTALHVASYNGQTAVTEYLIDHFGVNVDEQNDDDWTLLMMACQEGHLDTVQLLVSKQCDINIREKDGWTALHVASYNGQTAVTEYLIDHCGVNVNEQNDDDWTLLMMACQEGHLDTVQLLVSKQCDIDIREKDGWTALHVASYHGQTAVTEYLIDHCGVNVNEQNDNGSTSLMMACQEGHLDTVQRLVSKQCDITIRKKNGWAALHVASFYGQTAVTKYLINHCGVNVNEQNDHGWTSLMMACQEGHLDTVQLFVSKQCDINIRTKNGWTALYVASYHGETAVAEYLIDHCGVNVNEQNDNGWTSLIMACQEGHLDTVQLLVFKQCDINIRTKNGWTALHVASYHGQFAVTEYLIDHFGVNVDEQNDNGWTSLMMACQKGHLNTVSLLVSKQSDINIKEKNGWTALHFASFYGQTAVTEYLIEHCGVNVNEQNDNGWTSLMMACQKGHLDTVQLLVSKQCDINIREKDGWTALHVASYHGQTAVVTEDLIDHRGVNVNEQNDVPDDWSLPMMGQEDQLETVVLRLCDINIRTKDGSTALHVASSNGQTAVTEYLIDHCGVNVNEQNNDGRTSLMNACQKGHLDTVQLLVSKQCDINVRTKSGKTALFLSCSGGQNDIADFLIKRKDLTFAKSSHDVLLAALRNCRLSIVQQLASCVLFDKMTVVNDVLLIRRNEGDYNFSEPQLLSLLLARGASASVKNKHGKLPYEYASGESRRILKDAWVKSQYAELSVMGYSSPSRIKVCVIGDERAGKSTLIQSLQRTFIGSFASSIPWVSSIQEDPDRTACIKFEEANISSAGELVFCDFGGQKDFHKTHSLFFSSATVFVLVIDLTRPWDEILGSGFYWLSFTKCSLLVSDSKVRLILVGSRGEQVEPKLLKRLSCSLRAKFSKWFDISDEQFVLDCRSSRTQAMNSIKDHLSQLKQQCMKSAEKVPNIVEKVESNLLPLLRKLLLSSEHPLQALAKDDSLLPEQLSSLIRQLLRNDHQFSEESVAILSDFDLTVDKIQRTDRYCIPCGLLLAMIDKNVFSGLRKDVQTQILDFLHTYSSIIVFKEEDVLVVNPNWLCNNVIGSLMSPKEFPIHMTRTTNGIFSLEDVRGTLQEFNKRQKTQLIDVNEAIKILCRLDICYPLPYNPHKFQFPALIQEERPADAWMDNADKPVYVGRRLQCDNDTDIITPGTMPFFQAHVAAGLGSPESVSSLSPIVWKGGIKTFESVRGLRFETLVELTENERAIDIIVRGPMYSAAECYKLVQETKTRVEKMLDQRSPGTDRFELVLSSKDMENLAEPRHGYSCEEIDRTKRRDEHPKVCLDSTSEEYISDLIAVPDDHGNVVLPCEVKKCMLESFHQSTSEVAQQLTRSLEKQRTRLSSTSSADSVSIQWSRRMKATLPKLIKALEEAQQTNLLDMLKEEGLMIPIEENPLKVASASDDSENLVAIEDNEGELNEDELSGACFMPREEVDMHHEGKSTVKKSDDDDEIVKDYHIDAIENELFEDHDDVVSFGSKLLGWSRTKVLSYLSDRADRRIGQKVSLLLHRWTDKVETPTKSMLLSYLKKFDKEGIAIRLLKSCKKP
ncbi:uncharacterized protein [Oscarella lobularis]